LTADIAKIRRGLGIGIEGSGKPLVSSWDRDFKRNIDPHARIPEIHKLGTVEEDSVDEEDTVVRLIARHRRNRSIRVDVPHGCNDRAASSKWFDDGIDECSVVIGTAIEGVWPRALGVPDRPRVVEPVDADGGDPAVGIMSRNVRSGFGQIHELVSEHRLPGPIDPVEGNERTMPRPDCAELSQQVS
jgi:hypothetical protein